jgi:hypothetical protein
VAEVEPTVAIDPNAACPADVPHLPAQAFDSSSETLSQTVYQPVMTEADLA